MVGHLIKHNDDWMVKYDDNGILKLYPFCPETQKWSEKPEVKKFIKEDIESQKEEQKVKFLRSYLMLQMQLLIKIYKLEI